MCGKSQGPLVNGASLDRFLNGPFVKTGCCQTTQSGPILQFFGQNYYKFTFLQKKKPQSHRVTEWQTPKGTQYTGGQNFFVPDFNKLPYSLRSQGDNIDKGAPGHLKCFRKKPRKKERKKKWGKIKNRKSEKRQRQIKASKMKIRNLKSQLKAA